jgi:hypothetical protein
VRRPKLAEHRDQAKQGFGDIGLRKHRGQLEQPSLVTLGAPRRRIPLPAARVSIRICCKPSVNLTNFQTAAAPISGHRGHDPRCRVARHSGSQRTVCDRRRIQPTMRASFCPALGTRTNIKSILARERPAPSVYPRAEDAASSRTPARQYPGDQRFCSRRIFFRSGATRLGEINDSGASAVFTTPDAWIVNTARRESLGAGDVGVRPHPEMCE